MDKIPDITKLTWPLNVSIMGTIFSVFALIYDKDFIYYGFLTFLLGIACHFVDMIYVSYGGSDKPIKAWHVFFAQGVFMFVWVLSLLIIYN
jgi:hypothetical protein